jgi:hypothetical protein
MNDVMKILKDENIGPAFQTFDIDCHIKVNFRLSVRERVLARFSRIEGLKYRYLETH